MDNSSLIAEVVANPDSDLLTPGIFPELHYNSSSYGVQSEMIPQGCIPSLVHRNFGQLDPDAVAAGLNKTTLPKFESVSVKTSQPARA